MESQFEHTGIPVAIIGMACRLPGADNLDQFWDLLERGGSAVVELPEERLDQELYYDPRRGQRGKTYSKLGAIISNRQFDRQTCPIPPELERGVDNAHLLMCQTAAAACRHAGIDPFNLPVRNTGVFIGHAQGSSLAGDVIYGTCIEEAAQFLREVPGFQQLPPREQEAIIGELVETVRAQMPKLDADLPDVTINMVAGTISKAFRLTGPFMGVNSACASSLQAILLAARALQLGRVDMAIVGGASDCKSDSLVLFSNAQSMSETGSRPFDADADGLICGEGYVAVVLKTLPRALADGDRIQGVILGLGVSADGRGRSLWAPRKEGQVKAMERAYCHGLDMATLQYLEAHATSTGLGDATELNALSEILTSKFPPGKKIPITSVKANIGHALEAAGMSSLIKTLLCMQHRMFVPAINIRELNPKIDWEKAAFFIPQATAPWPEQTGGLPRRAAVNAFGIGGLNMHLVLEEFTEDRRAALVQKYSAAPKPRPAAAQRDAVAIIGMGCILPGAADPTKFWELLKSGRDPKGPAPPGRWRTDLGYNPQTRGPHRTPTILGGYITDFAYDWRAHKLPPKQVQQADPLQFMLLEAADQALVDAGYDKKKFDRTRVGVLVGSEFGGDFSAELGLGLRLPHIASILNQSFAARGLSSATAAQINEQFAEVLLKHWPALVDESGSFSTSTLASRITKTMDLMGGAAAIDAGDPSSAAVLATSVDLLLSGDCDMMICAGGQRRMNLPQYEGMALAGVLSTSDRPCAPFDAAASGIVPGEGVAVVMLKRLSDARRDGDRIHAIIRGIGAGHAESEADSIQLAMDRAFEVAGVDPSDVALIEMDGIGLPQRDQQQLRAVVSKYGRSQRQHPLLVSSVTGQIGHTAGASAMASLLKASLEVENGQMPATFGLETPIEIVMQNGGVIQAATQAMPIRHTTHDGRRLAAVSSCGKGLAFHIVLERGEKVAESETARAPAAQQNPLAAATTPAPTVALAPRAPAADCRIYRLGAATPDEMAARLERALADSASAFAAAGGSRFTPADQARLAIVATSADALARKLQMAAKQFANPDARPVLEQQGCFYRQLPARKARIAFLFSGQGSQYPGMLRELVRDIPAAAAAMRHFDAVMVQRGYQTFAQMAWDNPAQLGADVWVTQISMLLADLIVHTAVVDLGIRPDLVAGHSYGEFAALTAADVWDIEGVVTAARARYEAIEATPTARGTLMATTAAPRLIEQLAATLAHRTYVANYNAPDQTVVGGGPEALKQLAELLSARGHKAQMLTVPCPYHTPLLEGAGAILKRTLDTLRMRPPRVPLLSSVTNRYVAEPADIRANLVAQLTTPVRYVDLIRRIADEQDTVFVEVGPQQALTKLNRRILEGRTSVGTISSDNSKHPGVEQLYQVQAMLECLGLVGEQAVTRTSQAVPPRSPQPAMSKPEKGQIAHVDATQRRLEKMRRMATEGVQKTDGRGAAPGSNGDAATPARPHESYPAARNGDEPGHSLGPVAARLMRPHERARVAATPTAQPSSAPPAAAPLASTTDAPTRQAPPAGGGLNPAELEKFLINFVVEQTGYPPEVVELDADLEADLGIDSIKKAQLFGELAEYFDVQPTESMTLDDFPTLRHVMNFLVGARMKDGVASTAPSAFAPVAAAPALTGAAAAPMASAPIAPTPQSHGPRGSLNPAELEKFLINFVVEQTGYPPEVVELDADLEADLGIDSIKKAQLFGELAEYFDVQPTESMTLDDFPTLRHVMNFLARAPTKGGLAAGATPITEPTSAFRTQAPIAATAEVAPSVRMSGGLDPAELEKFLINFVVEQTGYPPEVVELDAEFEADLGIDSIKKAQLFGELAEYFDVQPTENMTLDDFPTLRHVVDFLVGSDLKKNSTANQNEPLEPDVASVAEPAATAPARNVVSYANPAANSQAPTEPKPTSAAAPKVMRPGGDAYETGLALGRRQQVEILRMLRRSADMAGPDFDESTVHGDENVDHLTPDQLDELRGIAGGVQVSLESILAHSRVILSDLRTGMPGPSVVSVGAPALDKSLVPVETPVAAGPEYDLHAEDNDQDDTHRFFIRELELPLGAPVPAMPQWHGAALIVGENSLGDALRRLLELAGVVVRQLPISEDVDETVAALDRIWSEQPTPHVFIVTPRDPDAADPSDEAAWMRRWYRVALLPYFVCQRWVQRAGEANLLDRCSVVAATSLNGTFGFSGTIGAPECGALTGLMKALYLEIAVMRNQRNMRAKAIDAPLDEPVDSLAANICRELASKEVDYEVAFSGGNRFVQCAYPEKAPVQKYADVRPGGIWVITGGARGITAACARELGRRFGLKLHLIGTSPLRAIDPEWRNLSAEEMKTLKVTVMRDARAAGRSMDDEWSRVQRDIEIDRALRAFADEGVDAAYHSCDVSDRNALGAVLNTIRRASGPIEGIVHGAGIERAASYERKPRGIVMATIASKVDGALNLMRLTERDPVRWFIGFGSISGRLGSNGQTDYCLASDALCKLVGWYRVRRPGVRAVGFHWHAWDEVGMAARPESAATMRITNGPSLMPKCEGLKHLVRELYAGAPRAEVMITSWEYHGRFYGTEHHPKPAEVSSLNSQQDISRQSTTEPPAGPWEKLPFEPLVSRHEMKMVAAPLSASSPVEVQWQGPACILGQNPTALALRDRLVAAGILVHLLPVSTSPEEVMAAMEAIYSSQPPRYLFLMSGRDEFSQSLLEQAGWNERRALGVVVPFLTAQHWFRLRSKAKDKTPVTIVAATSLGGDFGLSHHVALPDGGALSGMLKSIYIEDSRTTGRDVRVKVIDAPADEPASSLVDAICRELAADDPEVEVAWSRGRRSVVRSFERPVESLPKRPVPQGGNWIVTGGARGITAATAFELAKRFGVNLHIIGRSDVPRDDAPWRNCAPEQLNEIKAQVVRKAVAEGRSPEKDWERIRNDVEIYDTLQRFAAAGIGATYYSCDLSNWDRLASTLDEIRRHGPIEGIMHGAGYGKSYRFGTHNQEAFERTLAGKLDGAVALLSLTQQDPVRYLIGFGSIGGRYGGNGLSDYAAANDMFAKLCAWYRARRPACAVCCFDWQSWDEVGMAMLGDSAAGTKGVLKMAFIPPREGVEHVCRELQAGLPTTEVLITDRFFEKTFYPFIEGIDATAPVLASGDGDALARFPLVERIGPLAGGGSEADVQFDPTTDPFLLDHQFRGKPLLPAVIGLEAVAEAARLAGGKPVAAIRDAQLIEGMLFHTERKLAARIRAVGQHDGTIACELVTDLRNRADKLIKKDRAHLRATVELAGRSSGLDIPMPAPPTAWQAFEFQNIGPLYHGPTLHGVKATTFDARGGWGQLVALSLVQLGGSRAGREWIVSATLLDAGFYVCGIHAWFNAREAFSLPASIEAVRLGRMPRENENCLLAFECREIGPKQAIYNFTVFGEDRTAVLRVEGHRIVMVRS